MLATITVTCARIGACVGMHRGCPAPQGYTRQWPGWTFWVVGWLTKVLVVAHPAPCCWPPPLATLPSAELICHCTLLLAVLYLTLRRLAVAYRRILLIDWTHPGPITDYLLPSSINWTTEGFDRTFITDGPMMGRQPVNHPPIQQSAG